MLHLAISSDISRNMCIHNDSEGSHNTQNDHKLFQKTASKRISSVYKDTNISRQCDEIDAVSDHCNRILSTISFEFTNYEKNNE